MGYLTCDMWCGVNIVLNFSSLALLVWDQQCLEDSEQKDHRLNQVIKYLINDKGVSRTALAGYTVLVNKLTCFP